MANLEGITVPELDFWDITEEFFLSDSVHFYRTGVNPDLFDVFC